MVYWYTQCRTREAEDIVLAQRLRQLRRMKDLTQRELAEAVHLSPATIGLYEVGKRLPDHNTLVKLADFFNVSVDYLLGRTDDPSPPEDLRQVSDIDLSRVIVGTHRRGQLDLDTETPEDLTPEEIDFLNSVIRELRERFGKGKKKGDNR